MTTVYLQSCPVAEQRWRSCEASIDVSMSRSCQCRAYLPVQVGHAPAISHLSIHYDVVIRASIYLSNFRNASAPTFWRCSSTVAAWEGSLDPITRNGHEVLTDISVVFEDGSIIIECGFGKRMSLQLRQNERHSQGTKSSSLDNSCSAFNKLNKVCFRFECPESACGSTP